MTVGIFQMSLMEESAADCIREHKLGRYGQPKQIASAASFLLSADSSFVTGQALVVDGATRRAGIMG